MGLQELKTAGAERLIVDVLQTLLNLKPLISSVNHWFHFTSRTTVEVILEFFHFLAKFDVFGTKLQSYAHVSKLDRQTCLF